MFMNTIMEQLVSSSRTDVNNNKFCITTITVALRPTFALIQLTLPLCVESRLLIPAY
jgi:hypothetical protein